MYISQQPQNYFSLAIVIKQKIEPILIKSDPQIKMQGDILSTELTQCKGFKNINRFPSGLDPAFLHLLNSNDIPLRESIVLTRTEDKVNELSKVILLICRIDKDESTFKAFCQQAMQRFTRIRDSIEGPFNVSVQTLMSESPCVSHLTDSDEIYLRATSQDSVNLSEKQSGQLVITLESKNAVILERHFDHGESEKTESKLSFALENDLIITTQNTRVNKSRFMDLRYESNDSYSFQ